MSSKPRRFRAAFKFQVALEAAKGTKTLNELSSEYSAPDQSVEAGTTAPKAVLGPKSDLSATGASDLRANKLRGLPKVSIYFGP